jgi:hypothetical protein
MKPGDLEPYLNEYFKKYKKRLSVITVFRDPIDRHISSFFQWYSTKPHGNIIYKRSINELHEQLVEEIDSQKLVGQKESIYEICKELKISTSDLNYNFQTQHGLYEGKTIKLYLFRFDTLMKNLDGLFSLITGNEIVQYNKNMSNAKWYSEIYRAFKSSLKVPTHIVDAVYSSRRDLIELFYKGDYERYRLCR